MGKYKHSIIMLTVLAFFTGALFLASERLLSIGQVTSSGWVLGAGAVAATVLCFLLKGILEE